MLANDTMRSYGDTLTAAWLTAPAHGSIALNADGSFTYTPAANYNGPDSFTYKANDGTADSSTSSRSPSPSTPVNDAPVGGQRQLQRPTRTTLTAAAPGAWPTTPTPTATRWR